MKKQIIFLFFLLLSEVGISQTWNPIGPDTANISRIDFGVAVQRHVLCADNGFYVYNYGNNTCEFFSNGGLPVAGAGYFNNEKILVAMGDGSWSDGVYTFDLSTHDFEPMDWFVWPNFLHYHETTSTWWVGSDWGGLWKSADGVIWEAVETFSTFPCISLASQGQHLVVQLISDLTNGYWSNDNGESWYPSELSPGFSDMAFHYDGQLLGIFPYYSNSSGLWKSDDFGNSWQIEIYQDNMSAVCFDVFSEIIVGFDGEGVGIYHPGNGIDFINADLPNLNINKIQVNQTMSAPALFVSTDQGAYFSYDYYVGMDVDENNEAKIQLSPNPANGILNIKSDINLKSIKLINPSGQLVYKRNISGMAFQINTTEFSSGIYTLQLETEKGVSVRKVVVR